MYLLNYDFYDLHALFVFIRSNPEYIEVIPGLRTLSDYLTKPPAETGGIPSNYVRTVLAAHIPAGMQGATWVHVQNIYTANLLVMRDPAFYPLLAAVLDELAGALADEPERTRMLADAVHNIPLLLIEEKRPKKPIMASIKDYRSRYHAGFLEAQLKAL